MFNWVETTDPNDLLARDGEWRLEIPWLRGSSKDGHAYCLVRYYSEGGQYSAQLFHGNRGYWLGSKNSKEEAMNTCISYLKKMALAMEEFLNGGLC